MKFSAPNLAEGPFVNRRPMIRVATLLWVATLALLVVNGRNYWAYFSGQGEEETELAQLNLEIEQTRAEIDGAVERFRGFDLEWQADQIEFLNAKIAERTFSWSSLFDHLAEVLPRSVRVERVSPQFVSSTDTRRRRTKLRSDKDQVGLSVSGAGENAEVLLELVDKLYAHPNFKEPNLRVESRSKSGKTVNFSMNMTYVPPKPVLRKPRQAADAEAEAPDAEEAEESAAEVTS